MYDLMTAYYYIEHNEPVIKLFCRNKQKERVVIRVRGFKPYFYEATNNPTKDSLFDLFDRPMNKVYAQLPRDVKMLRRGKVTAEANVPFELRYLIDAGVYDGLTISKENKVVPCESIFVEPRVGYCDIEVLSPRLIMPKPEKPHYPIVTWQFKDSYTGRKVVLVLENQCRLKNGEQPFLHRGERVCVAGERVLQFKNELKDLLTQYMNVVVYCSTERNLVLGVKEIVEHFGFDCIAGWFFNSFDLPYAYYRCLEIRLDPNRLCPEGKFVVKKNPKNPRSYSIKYYGCECVDLLAQYRALTKPEGQKLTEDLKYIVKIECGFEYEDLGDMIDEVWNSDHEKLVHYCLDDVEALSVLDRHRELIKGFDVARRISGCFLSDAHIRNKLIMPLLWRESRKPIPTGRMEEVDKGLLLNSKAAEKRKISGAYVESPVVGLHENVCVIDVAAMYPSIMIALNISPETKCENGPLVAANGVRFKSYPIGIMARVVKKLDEQVKQLDEAMKNLDPTSKEYQLLSTYREKTKYTRNACYGIMVWEGFSLFDKQCGEAVTSTGKMITRSLMSHIRNLRKDGSQKFLCVAADTDSVHVKVNSFEESFLIHKEAQQFLDDLVEKNGWKTRIEINFDKFFKRALYVTKKRYAGFCTWQKGKETEKVMIFGLAAKRSDSAILTINLMKQFLELVLVDNDVDSAVELLREAILRFDTYPLSMIAVPKGIQKDLDDYKSKYAWALGVKFSTEHLGLSFRQDKRPRLIYGYIKSPIVIGGNEVNVPPCDYFCIRDEQDDWLKRYVVLNKEKMIDVVIWKKFEKLLAALGLEKGDVVKTNLRKTKLSEFW